MFYEEDMYVFVHQWDKYINLGYYSFAIQHVSHYTTDHPTIRLDYLEYITVHKQIIIINKWKMNDRKETLKM